MAITTGVTGDIAAGSVDLEVRSFTLTRSSGLTKYASSNTAGHKKSLPGVLDWSLDVNVYEGAFVTSGIREGDQLAVTITQSSGETLTGNGRAATVREAVDVEDGKPNEMVLTIEADGALS